MTCSRSACSFLVGMPVDGPARWTSMTTSGSSTMTARPMRLGLERDARAGAGGQPERAAVARADGGADRRDLVLGLERLDAEVLVARQLVEDVAGRRDRIGAVEQLAGRPASSAARKPSAVASLPVMFRYVPGRQLRRPDAVVRVEHLGRLAERVAGLERALVGLGDDRAGARTSRRSSGASGPCSARTART